MDERIKPIIILPKGEMSKADMKKLADNHIVVVEAKDPSLVRFTDPPPEGYSVQERSAIQLFRILMQRQGFNMTKADFATMYVDIILSGFIPPRISKVQK